MHKFRFISLVLLISISFFSCKTLTKKEFSISREIYSKGVCSETKLVDFFLQQNPLYPKNEITKIARLYIKESNYEGINSDVAFAQMCLETGYLTFGNLVTPQMNNFCGLGAIDKEHPGEVFESVQMGIRAHIQHLHAYSTTEEISLKNELIDNRYKWVRPRGKAKTIFELTRTWAMDSEYGNKIDRILNQMEFVQ